MLRRYRLLLLAYPRWYRRLHGEDMITATLDAFEAGRHVSATRFVLAGLRCRLRVAAAPWPDVTHAKAVANTVLPTVTLDESARRDHVIGPWLADADSPLMRVAGSPEVRPGGVYLTYQLARPAEEVGPAMAAAKAAL